MSLLGFLAHQKPSYTDKVWMTKHAAVKGMITDALQALTQSEVPIVISFFRDKQREVIDFVSANNVPYTMIDVNTAFEVYQDKSVLVLDAQWLGSSQAVDFIKDQCRSASVNLLFYGHYPIPEKELQLLKKISPLGEIAKIKFFSSMDDRTFEMFGGENIKSMMEKMGLKEDEAIEHDMVSKAMERAREKIAGTIATEIKTTTESEWYERNYKKI